MTHDVHKPAGFSCSRVARGSRTAGTGTERFRHLTELASIRDVSISDRRARSLFEAIAQDCIATFARQASEAFAVPFSVSVCEELNSFRFRQKEPAATAHLDKFFHASQAKRALRCRNREDMGRIFIGYDRIDLIFEPVKTAAERAFCSSVSVNSATAESSS
jgi:hypothetical protein